MSINQVSTGVGLSALSAGPKVLISFTEMRDFLTLLTDEISSWEQYNSNVANLDSTSFSLSGNYYTEMVTNLELIGSDINKYHNEYLQFLNNLVKTMDKYITEFEELNQPK